MLNLKHKEVRELFDDYKRDRSLHKPAMLYNYFNLHNIVVMKEKDRERILEQATEIEEKAHELALNKYFQIDHETYQKLAQRGVRADDIKYRAKWLAVTEYFNWLIKNNHKPFKSMI